MYKEVRELIDAFHQEYPDVSAIFRMRHYDGRWTARVDSRPVNGVFHRTTYVYSGKWNKATVERIMNERLWEGEEEG